MDWKLFSMTRGVRPTVDVDQVGLQMWGMAVLVIGLSLLMRLNNQSAILQIIVPGALLVYVVGLFLIALGVLHVVRTHFRAIKTRHRAHLRYARSALFPLWYHVYGVPSAGASARAQRWASLRFDHGQAWAWGTECLIAAGIIETALMLAEQHPLWHQIGTLAVLAVVRTTLLAVRQDVAAHGHSSATIRMI
jgi:uncharacterized membrane protein